MDRQNLGWRPWSQPVAKPPFFPLGQAVRLRRWLAPNLKTWELRATSRIKREFEASLGPKLVRFSSSSIAMVEGTSGEVVANHPLDTERWSWFVGSVCGMAALVGRLMTISILSAPRWRLHRIVPTSITNCKAFKICTLRQQLPGALDLKSVSNKFLSTDITCIHGAECINRYRNVASDLAEALHSRNKNQRWGQRQSKPQSHWPHVFIIPVLTTFFKLTTLAGYNKWDMRFQDVSRPSELTAPAEFAELFIVRFEIATSKRHGHWRHKGGEAEYYAVFFHHS